MITNVDRLDAVEHHLKFMIGRRHAMVVAGFSGLGYENLGLLEREFCKILGGKICEYGRANLVVIAGATVDGIGHVYQLAKRWGVATLGIVSQASQHPENAPYVKFSPYCDNIILVKSTEATSWAVKSPLNQSYMVTAALGGSLPGSLGGSFYAFGGGEVAVAEVEEAWERGVVSHVYADFEPDPVKVKAKGLTCSTPLRNLLRGRK